MTKALVLVLAAALVACAPQPEPEVEAARAQPAPPPPQYIAEDSIIFTRTIERAYAERLDTLPIGEVVAAVGQWFVGQPYEPFTMEQPGPEHLVINLRKFDCVTFVENSLAFARTIKMGKRDFATFRDQITRMRYRDGVINGYPSRLHYFSEWIANNEAKGLLANQTPKLGVVDAEPIDFMTTHRDSYKQLVDSAFYTEIATIEKRLSAQPRYMIPETRIAELEANVKNGDVIAATTDLKGLDVAHTGIALWRNGRLHFMHAPLVGSVVEITEGPLADRILANKRQDGIMVARPLNP